MGRRGFTLLEVMISVSILTAVTGILFALALGLAQAAQVQEARITASDDARSGMVFVTRILRQASVQSIAWNTLPADTLSFRAAADVSGNGLAVDQDVNLELGPVLTISRDLNDLNNDGLTDTQLIITDGTQTRVITNGLTPAGAAGANRGLWFESTGRGIRVLIETQRNSDSRGRPVNTRLVETVVPRN